MSGLFYSFISQPLFNSLVFLYKYAAFQDLGLAIVFLTVLVRVVLYPLSYKAFRNQVVMQKIQPEIKRIQKEHKDDKEKQAKLMIELWKTHKVNPFSGILLLFIQLPILIALYRIFLNGFSPEAMAGLYSFITPPEVVHDTLLGLISLKEKSILIVGLAAILQYLHGRMMLPKTAPGEAASKTAQNMVYFGPVMTIGFLSFLPAAVGVYWAATSAFSVFQQRLINRSLKTKDEKHGKDSGNSGAIDPASKS